MKICYFGIYDKNFSRNRIYMSGLHDIGVEIIECSDQSNGFSKWFNLLRKFKVLNEQYDVVLVGYPGHVVVPLAKFISKKLVIADLLGSLYDAEKNSHESGFFGLLKARVADFFAVMFADIVLLESEAQKKYFETRFGESKKYHVLYTGSYFGTLLDEINSYKPSMENFVVIFRGKLTPECGIKYILEAAEILKENLQIKFKIVGRGYLLREAQQIIEDKNLTNVELVSDYLSDEEFIKQYDGCSLALGQFENNPRLSRTIPHKAFEAFALGIPYLSGDASAIREIIIENETGFFVPLANSSVLAEKIENLSKNQALLEEVSKNSTGMFKKYYSPIRLAQDLVEIIKVLQK